MVQSAAFFIAILWFTFTVFTRFEIFQALLRNVNKKLQLIAWKRSQISRNSLKTSRFQRLRLINVCWVFILGFQEFISREKRGCSCWYSVTQSSNNSKFSLKANGFVNIAHFWKSSLLNQTLLLFSSKVCLIAGIMMALEGIPLKLIQNI